MSMSLMNLSLWVLPSLSMLFSALYWYNSENYTQTLVSLPVERSSIFISRWLTLSLILFSCFLIGVIFPLTIYGYFGPHILFLLIISLFINFIFVSLGLFIAILKNDKLFTITIFAVICECDS
jgi:Cu-processing system permease protein